MLLAMLGSGSNVKVKVKREREECFDGEILEMTADRHFRHRVEYIPIIID